MLDQKQQNTHRSNSYHISPDGWVNTPNGIVYDFAIRIQTILESIDKIPELFSWFDYKSTLLETNNTHTSPHLQELALNWLETAIIEHVRQNITFRLHEQPIDDNWEIVGYELLSRMWIKNRWWEELSWEQRELVLKLFRVIWQSFIIFKTVFTQLCVAIRDNNAPRWERHINLEVADIIHPDLVKTIRDVSRAAWIQLDNENVVLELVEHQDTVWYESKICELQQELDKDLWIELELDDRFDGKLQTDHIISEAEKLNTKRIKVDGKMTMKIWSLYKDKFFASYKSHKQLLEEIAQTFKKLAQKWYTITVEWIETQEMADYFRDFMWISRQQWFRIDEQSWMSKS